MNDSRVWGLHLLFLCLLVAILPSVARAEEPVDKKLVSKDFFEDLLTPRGNLERAVLGINAFANDPRFGTVGAQFREVRTKLGLKRYRLLFAWNDAVQPSPGSPIFFGFYDELARSLPRGSEAVVVLTGLPSWMTTSKNWTSGDPRRTFVDRWVKAVVARYKGNASIKAWQIWNEPNNPSNVDNQTMEMLDDPAAYVHLLSRALEMVRSIAPRKLVVSAATTAINQNYPETLAYNRALVAAGGLNACDLFAIHYYGRSIENVLVTGGVRDFLRSFTKPIWVTESGAKGTTAQLEYAQRIFPFLLGLSSNIRRVYIYQFTEATGADVTYGLRNLTVGRVLSDLYIYLRDHPGRLKKG